MQIIADLDRARSIWLDNAANEEVIAQYEEFLNNNELDSACYLLEDYAETHAVNQDFWLALRDAADKMELYSLASKYGELAKSARGTA